MATANVVKVNLDKKVVRTSKNSVYYTQKCYVVFNSAANADAHVALTANDGTNYVPTGTFKVGGLTYAITDKRTDVNEQVVTVDIEWAYEGADPTKPSSATIWHTKLDVSGVEYEDVLRRKDYSDPPKVIGVNTAGDKMNTNIKIPRMVRVYSITYRAADWPEEDYENLFGKTNDSAITLNIWGRTKTFAKNTLLLKEVKHSLDYANDTDSSGQPVTYPYWNVLLELHYMEKEWSIMVESVGFQEKTTDGKKQPIFTTNSDGTKSNHRTPEPWPLDANGKALTANTDTGAIITYIPYESTSFAILQTIPFNLDGDEV